MALNHLVEGSNPSPLTKIAQSRGDIEINTKVLSYQVVPDHWRNKVYTKPTRNLAPIEDPIVKEILKGNTVLVEAQVPLDRKSSLYKNLYATLAVRGFRLKMHLFDEIDKDIYRALLMWAEPFIVLWNCTRCGNFEVSSPDTKPQSKGCESIKGVHSWRRVDKTHPKRLREDIAA